MSYITALLVTAMLSVSAGAQNISPRPRLVVGITIEGLDYDMLKSLQNYFGNGGFKHILNNGATVRAIDYGSNVDAAAAMAMLYTGAAPSVNGIGSRYVYNPETKRGRHVLFDASKIGNFTDETLSPAGIKVSTLSDEIRMDSNGTVVSVAPSSHAAIISAGHAANSAFWLNDANGNWATTTYYKDMPPAVTARNYKLPLSGRIDTISWMPLLPVVAYTPATGASGQPFKYTFRKNDPSAYKRFKTSPKVNTEITILASDLLTTLNLGRGSGMDMLNVTYTLAPYIHSTGNDIRIEQMDAYLRLDREMARLLSLVESTAGQQNSVIFITGVPAQPAARRDDEKWGIPYGQFSARKATSLLNMYLMAVHGNGEWVTGYFDNHFYLNHTLAKEHDIDISALRTEAAEFLGRMAGVSTVYTIEDITAARVGDNPEALKRNTVLTTSGDIIIEINPGWEIVEDTTGSTSPNVVKRTSATAHPLFILAPDVQATLYTTPIDARAVCPTLSRIIRVRSPNAVSTQAIPL